MHIAVAMILRVWALYNRSMLVLGTLLTIYTIEEIMLLIYYAIPTAQSGTESELKCLLSYDIK